VARSKALSMLVSMNKFNVLVKRTNFRKPGGITNMKIIILFFAIFNISFLSAQDITNKGHMEKEQRINPEPEYDKTGNQTKLKFYFPSGGIQREMFFKNGVESYSIFYDKEGICLGVLSMAEGKYNGDEFKFYWDDVAEHNLYKEGKIIRAWMFHNDHLRSDTQMDGLSYFYDIDNNKTYQCIFKDGKPFEGTVFEYKWWTRVSTILATYKNGMLDGNYSEFDSFDDEKLLKSSLRPVIICFYKENKKDGFAREYYKGSLVKTLNYKDGQLDGETRQYGLEGKLISTIIYIENIPFQGTLYEYDNYHHLTSITNYNNGKLDGEQKYFEEGTLFEAKIFNHGIILKKTFFLNDQSYVLDYKNGEPFSGVDKDFNCVSEYQNSHILFRKNFDGFFAKDIDETKLRSLERFEGNDKSVKEIYFNNDPTHKKIQISYVKSVREGPVTFYNFNGEVIGSGVYHQSLPREGKFVLYSSYQADDYVIFEIKNRRFTAVKYSQGKVIKKFRYSRFISRLKAVPYLVMTLGSRSNWGLFGKSYGSKKTKEDRKNLSFQEFFFDVKKAVSGEGYDPEFAD
jgi:antitoxin component YwqK of YwqJK toxin-antitoxin module